MNFIKNLRDLRPMDAEQRYKNFKPSKLFVKNPNLSLLLFAVENLSLGAFYGGLLACLAAGYFWGERAAV